MTSLQNNNGEESVGLNLVRLLLLLLLVLTVTSTEGPTATCAAALGLRCLGSQLFGCSARA